MGENNGFEGLLSDQIAKPSMCGARRLKESAGPFPDDRSRDRTAAHDEVWEFIRVAAGLLVAAVTAATLFVMGWPIVTGRRLFPTNISERHIWLTACVVALAYAIVLGLILIPTEPKPHPRET